MPRTCVMSSQLVHGLNGRPISWPTLLNGTDRVRICLHVGKTQGTLYALVANTAILRGA
jgi:7-keto-8-aminopelargonate synthetase-like enzyme